MESLVEAGGDGRTMLASRLGEWVNSPPEGLPTQAARQAHILEPRLQRHAGVTITLTPTGTLIDGSAGAVMTRTVDASVGNFVLRDVPMGRYTVRATRSGAPLVIRMRHTAGYVADVTADFEPADNGATSYGIYFMVATTNW